MEKLFSSMQEILSPVNCIVYEIPEFQREYAWGKDQWNALFDKIIVMDVHIHWAYTIRIWNNYA